MRFTSTGVDGAFIVDLEPSRDTRGSFARTFCPEEFAAAGIDFRVAQANISRNTRRHTLRGMHLQAEPHGEAKLVQCVRGRIFDVAVDLRRGSPTWQKFAAVELAADNDRLFYIPPGCAHGFLTLEDDSDILYYMGSAYVAGVDAGVRWDDPAFAIDWPAPPQVIAPRDAHYVDYRP
jgi:dTDP-4-dehydrorhamnose 3,5-epimerase